MQLPIVQRHCQIWSERRYAPAQEIVKVLVVDDDNDIAESLSILLGMRNLHARFVLGGLAALDMVPNWRPHAILLDIWMPNLDGFETARMLRKLDTGFGVVIIAHTALPEHHVQPRGV